MQDQLRQQREVAALRGGSSTTDAAPAGQRSSDVVDMFDGVSEAVRLHLELIARRAPDRDAALEQIIDVVVDGSPRKRAAIVGAITTNTLLHQQWQRAWLQLRG